MFAKIMHAIFGPAFLSNVIVSLLLFGLTKPAPAIEAQKPKISLADRIQLENEIHREEFYGDVRLLHAPYPIDVQFSADGSVLFSLAETVRLWRSDTGAYLGSIAGPVRFRRFAQLNHSRWIITIDDIEELWEHSWYSGVPEVLPKLRLWDVATGTCLAVRHLGIPMNATRIWIPTLVTAEQSQTAYLILQYLEERTENTPHYHLIGFHGKNLLPTCKLELESRSNSLVWDPRSSQLYVYGEYRVSAFDPTSKKILWTSVPGNFVEPTETIDELIVIDQPLDISKYLPAEKKTSNSVLVTFQQSVKGPTLQNWGLLDYQTGQLKKRGIFKGVKEPESNRPDKQKKELSIYWTYDSLDDSFKAINIVKDYSLLSIPRKSDAFDSISRSQSEMHNRYLDQDDHRYVDEKVTWSRAANRVCFIVEKSAEINLFDSRTGKQISPATGTVNALSSISANKFSGSFDYHDVSVFQLKARDQIRRTFNTEVPENSCVAISADAKRLVVGEASGKATVWNLSNHKKLFTLTGVSNELLCVAADTSQNRIVAGDLNGVFWRWNYPTPFKATSEKTQRIKAERNSKQTKLPYQEVLFYYELTFPLCALSPNGQLSLCFQPLDWKDEDGELETSPGLNLVANLIFEPKYGEVIAIENATKQTILTPAVHHKSVLIQIKSSWNGRFALFVFNTGQVTIIDLQEGTLESIIQTNDKEIVDVDFHPDQKTLLVASFRGGVTAWNTDTYLKTGSLQLYDARLNQISSRVAKQGFDLVIGTRDTGLIVKRGVFPKSAQKPERPAALNLPYGGPLQGD